MALFGAGSSVRVGWRAARLGSGFQGFAASIGGSFILAGGLGARLSFYWI